MKQQELWDGPTWSAWWRSPEPGSQWVRLAVAGAEGEAWRIGLALLGGATAIYKRYVAWHAEQGNPGRPMSQTQFGGQLVDRGFERAKVSVKVYRGIDVASRDEPGGRDLPW